MPDCENCGINVPRKVTALDGGPVRVVVTFCPSCGTEVDGGVSDD